MAPFFFGRSAVVNDLDVFRLNSQLPSASSSIIETDADRFAEHQFAFGHALR
jgi:hypothetical protein